MPRTYLTLTLTVLMLFTASCRFWRVRGAQYLQDGTLVSKRPLIVSTAPAVINFGGCTGTLVEGCVITAAHCLTNWGARGQVFSSPDGSEVTRGRDQRIDKENDLAIVKLEKAFAGYYADRSVLADKDPELGTLGFVVGRGKTVAKGRVGKIWAIPSGGKWLGFLPYPSAIVNGDSGGPYIVRDEKGVPRVVAVVSEARSVPTSILDGMTVGGDSARFVSVSRRYGWIMTAMGDLRCRENAGGGLSPERALEYVLNTPRTLELSSSQKRRLRTALARVLTPVTPIVAPESELLLAAFLKQSVFLYPPRKEKNLYRISLVDKRTYSSAGEIVITDGKRVEFRFLDRETRTLASSDRDPLSHVILEEVLPQVPAAFSAVTAALIVKDIISSPTDVAFYPPEQVGPERYYLLIASSDTRQPVGAVSFDGEEVDVVSFLPPQTHIFPNGP